MRLTQRTDYALRVLMYCALHQSRSAPPTISEIAGLHQISRSHLMKVVMDLAAQGWLATTRGRGGGLRLLKPADQVLIGEVIRNMEEDFTMVECFNAEGNLCQIEGQCRLKGVLARALKAYMTVLDGVTLDDLVRTADPLAPVPIQFTRN